MKIALDKLICNKVFVLHVEKGYEERKKHIEAQMKLHNIDFEYMLDGDIPNLNEALLDNYFINNMKSPTAATSVATKHLFVYKKILEENLDNALIFEDDVLLHKNFNHIFNKTIRELQNLKLNDKEAIMISYENSGLEYLSKTEIKSSYYLYPKKDTRCAAAYYINKQAAKTFISIATHQKIELTIDWWHSYLAKENLLTVYWCFPTIVEQGSHNGMFNSAIDTKKRGVYYFIKFKIEKFYKKHIRILFK